MFEEIISCMGIIGNALRILHCHCESIWTKQSLSHSVTSLEIASSSILWISLRSIWTPRDDNTFDVFILVLCSTEKSFLDQAGKDMANGDVNFLNSLSLLR